MSTKNLNRDEKLLALKIKLEQDKRLASSYLESMTFSALQEEALVSILNRESKITILCGANQSGKTTIGGLATLIFATGIIPTSIKHRVDPEKFKFQRGDYLSVALSFSLSNLISQAKVFHLLPRNLYKYFSKEFRILTLQNESTILFKSVESKEEKFQGLVLNGIWTDEESPQAVWDECHPRTWARKGWMFLTFSPVQGLSWAYKELYLKSKDYTWTRNIHNIPEEPGIVHTLEEIDKMRERILVHSSNSPEFENSDIRFFQMTLYDNIHIPANEIQMAEKKFKDDPFQYQARILGRFVNLVGRQVFNTDKLLTIQSRLADEGKRYEFKDGVLTLNQRGRLVIYKDHDPDRIYVIGSDIAEGLKTGDFTVANILDRATGEQVAVWQGHVSPDEWGGILYSLGKFYNYAKLAPERNSHGLGVVDKLRSLKYPNIYYETDVSNETITKGYVGAKRFGWLTNHKTKPIMIQNLSNYINSGQLKLNDKATIEELLTYEYDDDGKMHARDGCHDDRVMSLAIALMAFKKTPIIKSGDGSIKYDSKISQSLGY